MTGTTRPIPVILCGKTEKIGSVVIDYLKPEFEVIHFVFFQNLTDGKREIASLFTPNPIPATNDLGTRDYSRTPRAVLLGGAYDIETVILMKDFCRGKGVPDVMWLQADLSLPAPPMSEPAAYGKALMKRMKRKLLEVKEEGNLGEGGGGVSETTMY